MPFFIISDKNTLDFSPVKRESETVHPASSSVIKSRQIFNDSTDKMEEVSSGFHHWRVESFTYRGKPCKQDRPWALMSATTVVYFFLNDLHEFFVTNNETFHYSWQQDFSGKPFPCEELCLTVKTCPRGPERLNHSLKRSQKRPQKKQSNNDKSRGCRLQWQEAPPGSVWISGASGLNVSLSTTAGNGVRNSARPTGYQ